MHIQSLPSPLTPILTAALHAADPREAVRRHLRRDGETLMVGASPIALNGREIRVVAAGKAAAPMAATVLALLGNRPVRGVVVTKHGHVSDDCAPLTVIEAGHPVPDEGSLRGGEAMCAALADCDERTLVLACISGGASALLVTPQPGISLRTVMAINDALLRSGADIREMNAVRSRIDRLKAGGLVRMAAPAQVIGLILSDVIGDPLEVIASGLTHEPRATNVLVGNNAQACAAAAAAATESGYTARIVTTELRGEAREAGDRIAREIAAAPPRTALIYGGEPTVTLHGSGKGGRNQELALAAALTLDGHQSRLTVAALGTDGTDGPTDAAGAFATSDTLTRARVLGLDAADYLARNDSYTFFEQLGDLILTGPTGTNVADVVVALAH